MCISPVSIETTCAATSWQFEAPAVLQGQFILLSRSRVSLLRVTEYRHSCNFNFDEVRGVL